MRLIDMLAGRPSDDPGDRPSGERIVVEPSVSLLRSIDNCAKAKNLTREQSLAAYAALGVVAEKAAGGLLGALSERARELSSGKVDPRAQELRLAEGIAAKNALEDAAKACEEIVKNLTREQCGADYGLRSLEAAKTAKACAAAIREIKKAVVEKATRA